MLKRLKEIKWGKIFSTSVLISFILPIAFLIYKIITTTNEIDINNTDRTRSDYVLMLIQCLLGIVAMVLPEKASQKFKMWEPTYGTKIFYDSTLTKNNEGLYVCTTTFYTNSTKKNIQGKTVLTVEDNGSRAIIKKLSSK